MFYFVYMDLSVNVFVFYNENSECVFYDLVVILNIRCFMLYMQIFSILKDKIVLSWFVM